MGLWWFIRAAFGFEDEKPPFDADKATKATAYAEDLMEIKRTTMSMRNPIPKKPVVVPIDFDFHKVALAAAAIELKKQEEVKRTFANSPAFMTVLKLAIEKRFSCDKLTRVILVSRTDAGLIDLSKADFGVFAQECATLFNTNGIYNTSVHGNNILIQLSAVDAYLNKLEKEYKEEPDKTITQSAYR